MRSGIVGDRAQVVRDVLADLAVAARRAALEHAVAVEQRDRQAVDLRLADVARTRGSSIPSRARWLRIRADPGAQLLLACARWPARASAAGGVTFSQRVETGSPPTRCVGESGVTQLGVLGLDRRAARRAARRSRRRRSPGRRGRSSGGRGGRSWSRSSAARASRLGRRRLTRHLLAPPARAAARGRAPAARPCPRRR